MKMHTRSLIKILREQLTIPKLGVEVGVWQGENSANLLRAFEDLRLAMVDPYEPMTNSPDRRMAAKTDDEFLMAWNSALERTSFAEDRSSILMMTSELAVRMFHRQEADFVFIDADHTYEHVRQDIALWTPIVRSGGILCGHDYNGRGDKLGVFGVKRAVDETFGGKVNVGNAMVWWVRM